MSRPSPLLNPLDDPIAVALACVALVLLVRLGLLALLPALAVAAAVGVGLATLRHRRRNRGSQLLEARLRTRIEGALARSQELAGQASLVAGEAMARFQDPTQLEALGLVQLCCERLRQLPERIEQRRPLLESGGGVLLSSEELSRRLAREEAALRREEAGPLRVERQRLVEQLRRNLEASERGMDEREARLVALSTRLEQIDGGLRHLRGQVDRHWPSSQASDAAMAEALEPLDSALDQIERQLEEGAR
ncbi:MAG: hypothetical protein ACKO5F_15815 [Synechococcus sp.]